MQIGNAFPFNARPFQGAPGDVIIAVITSRYEKLATFSKAALFYKLPVEMVAKMAAKSVRTYYLRQDSVLSAAWVSFSEFSNNSTVHGVKYFVERRRHPAERVFWIISFLITLYGCIKMINNVYERWELSPSFDDKSTPVWDIPFPAVTICPETKAKVKNLNMTKVYEEIVTNGSWNLTVDELRNAEALTQICRPHLFENFEFNSGLKPEEIISTLNALKISLFESTFYCVWRDTVEDCSQYFSETLTEEGFCYTFNALERHEIFRDLK